MLKKYRAMAAGHGILELIDGAVDRGLEGGDACSVASTAVVVDISIVVVLGVVIIIIIVSMAGIEAVLFGEGVVLFVVVDVGRGSGVGIVEVVAGALVRRRRRRRLQFLFLEETHADIVGVCDQ